MEATATDNGRMIKLASPGTRVFLYHNMELGRSGPFWKKKAGFFNKKKHTFFWFLHAALQWEESQRAVMYDRTKADWFLQYTDGKGNKNGTIYNEARDEA